jgi:hypothetical protein
LACIADADGHPQIEYVRDPACVRTKKIIQKVGNVSPNSGRERNEAAFTHYRVGACNGVRRACNGTVDFFKYTDAAVKAMTENPQDRSAQAAKL